MCARKEQIMTPLGIISLSVLNWGMDVDVAVKVQSSNTSIKGGTTSKNVFFYYV